MKRSRIAWLTVVILLLLVVLLALFLPARWVMPWLQPRLHGVTLEGVHGLVWDGVAEQVRGPDGEPLGQVRWRLSRRALWGRLDLRLGFIGPQLEANGHLQRDAQGRPVWTDVTLRAGLASWISRLDFPVGRPQGTLTIGVQRAVLQGNWPVELEGQAQWRDATMQLGTQTITLGDFAMGVDGANGVLRGRLRDLGKGPLRAEGEWQASPLGWRLDLLLQPRTADPALRRWIARLGRPEADGTVRLHRRGGLAAATPESNR